jgi:hypothetical protein
MRNTVADRGVSRPTDFIVVFKKETTKAQISNTIDEITKAGMSHIIVCNHIVLYLTLTINYQPSTINYQLRWNFVYMQVVRSTAAST